MQAALIYVGRAKFYAATLSNVNYSNYKHGDVAKIGCYARNV